MNGVAITTSSEVEKFAHTSSGIRKKLIPGARIVMIVTRKLSAVKIEEKPANCTPIEKNSCPSGIVVDSGAYAVQPDANEPPGARKLISMIAPPSGSSQYGQRVQPRERHVRRADHQRQHEVREPGEHRDHEQEDQDGRVDREDAVVLLGGQELHPRLGELDADQHRQQAADEQEEERGDRVLDPDHLVVGVDAEVVAPAVGAVAGVVLGPGQPARRPVEPVVAGPDPDQERERDREQRHGRDGVARDHRVDVLEPPDQRGDPEREAEADDLEERGPVPARGAQLGRQRNAGPGPDCATASETAVAISRSPPFDLDHGADDRHFATLARNVTSDWSAIRHCRLHRSVRRGCRCPRRRHSGPGGSRSALELVVVVGGLAARRAPRASPGRRADSRPAAACRSAAARWPAAPASHDWNADGDDHVHGRAHQRVAGAAQLGALDRVGAEPGRGDAAAWS